MLQFWLEAHTGKVIVTPNAELILMAKKNKAFLDHLNASDLSLPDSVSLRYAVAALTDESLGHRHPGVAALERLALLCAGGGKRLLLLGGEPGVAARAAAALMGKIPALNAVAIDPGEISYDGTRVVIEPSVIREIQRAAPDAVAVALGAPKQEAFLYQAHEQAPEVRIWIAVGGALDMLSGQKRRAPVWMQTVGLEWAWRLLVEPKRARRILDAAVVFPFTVALSTLCTHRFLRAVRRVFREVSRQLRGL